MSGAFTWCSNHWGLVEQADEMANAGTDFAKIAIKRAICKILTKNDRARKIYEKKVKTAETSLNSRPK